MKLLLKLDKWVYNKFQLEFLNLDMDRIKYAFLTKIWQTRVALWVWKCQGELLNLNRGILASLKHKIVVDILKFPEHQTTLKSEFWNSRYHENKMTIEQSI